MLRFPMFMLPAALLAGFISTGCTPKIGEGKSAGECSDGLDNDDDGAIDCLDAGCMGYDVCGGGTDSPDDTDTDTTQPSDSDVSGVPVATDPEIMINEFMASNSTAYEDAEYPGTYPDWIEIINLTDTAINLEGYFFTDDLTECSKHEVVTGATIEANGYAVFFADDDEDEGAYHLGFNLARAGEQIGLCRADMTPLTKIEFGEQVTDYSAARIPDASDKWEFDDTPTPGETNAL